MTRHKFITWVVAAAAAVAVGSYAVGASKIGQEVAIPVHLQDGQEFQMTTAQLVPFGKTLFTAMWTSQEGAGRPMTKGTGNPISDPTNPLVFPHNFNRISGPDTNSCSGCHNKPDIGGGGDIVGNTNPGPRAGVGQLTADGNGNLTGSETQSNNGTIVTGVTETGTYAVNSDCAGSATLTLNKGDTTTRHFNFQLLHNSEEVLAIVTDSGRIETIDFKQQN